MNYPKIIIKANELLGKVGLDLYIVLLGIGIIVLLEYVIRDLEKNNGYSRAKTNKLLLFMGISLVAAYVFAMLFDSLFHYFASGVFELATITYIGGFIGGVVIFIVLIYYFYPEEKANILKLLNIIIPGVVLAHAIGRVGCFTAGCCYGKPTNSIFGILFPEGTNPYIDGIRVPIHPTQLYEAFFLFILFFLLKYITFLKRNKFAFYLILYGIFRFFIETFLRDDPRGELFKLPPSLLLSIIMVGVGLGIILFGKYKKKKTLEKI